MFKALKFATMLLVVSSSTAAALASGLTASKVTTAVYCCTAPIESNRISNFATATVGSGVEYPDPTFLSIVNGVTISRSAIDISSGAIDIDYTAASQTFAGSFNGFVFTFSGAPPITSVSLDPLSTLQPVSYSFTSNSILLDLANRSITSASRVLLNIGTAPSLLGDYNGDGAIDGGDYVVWRKVRASGGTNLFNDPTPGIVDQSDYTYWRSRFYSSSGGGLSSTEVPEPAAGAILIAGLLVVPLMRRR